MTLAIARRDKAERGTSATGTTCCGSFSATLIGVRAGWRLRLAADSTQGRGICDGGSEDGQAWMSSWRDTLRRGAQPLFQQGVAGEESDGGAG